MNAHPIFHILRAAAASLLLLGASQAYAAGDAGSKDKAATNSAKSSQKDSAKQIYGSQLMTPEERTAYRQKMRAAKTVEEREKLRTEHHEAMQERAKERGVSLPDAPPARGAGMGPGAGPRQGMGMGPGAGSGAGRGGPPPSP